MLCSFSALNLNPPSKKTQHTVRDPHPPSHRLLASFSVPRDLARWKVFSDAAHGGTTAASLSPSRLFPGTAEFRGALACAGASGRARSGFAGMTVQLGGGEGDAEESPFGERTAASSSSSSGEEAGSSSSSSSSSSPPPPLRSSPPLDLSAFDALRLRVRNADGRPWVVSLRTENWLVGDGAGGGCHDVWQAFLFAPDARKGAEARRRAGGSSGSGGSGSGGDESRTDNGWTTAELPLSRFLLTHRGRLVEARVSMNAARVVSLGLAPAPLPPSPSTGDGNVETGGDGGEGGEEAPAEGAFCLGLDSITAVSTSRGLLTREEAEEAERAERDREREVGKT